MASYSSASVLNDTPHVTNSTKHLNPNGAVSNALKRRAQSLIQDRSIDAQSRLIIRYALEINDPWLAELVSRVDAGETISDDTFRADTPHTTADALSEEKIEVLTELISRSGDEPETKSAALFVLMATLENATQPKVLANAAKHFALLSVAK